MTSSTNSSTCAIEESLLENFVPITFLNTRAVKLVHTAPRFGHTNDLLALISDEQGAKANYIKGLVASSIAIFCLFLVWTCALLYFKYRGPSNYGWLSGQRILLPPKPKPNQNENHLDDDDDDDEDMDMTVEEWEQLYEKTLKHHRTMKVLVFMACVFTILSSILMVAFGADALRRTKLDGQVSLHLGIDILTAIGAILEQMVDGLETLQEDVLTFMGMLNGICPNVRSRICTNVRIPTTCNSEGIFVNRTVEALSAFFGSNYTLKSVMEGAHGSVLDMVAFGESIDYKVEDYNLTFVFAGVFVMLLSLLCIFMMVSLVRQRTFRLKVFLQNCVVFPLFIFLLSLGFILSMVFVIGSQALADTCIDDPDGRLLKITDNQIDNIPFSPMVHQIITWYLTQCQVKPVELVQTFADVNRGTQRISEMEANLLEFQATKEAICGPVDTAPILAAVRRSSA